MALLTVAHRQAASNYNDPCRHEKAAHYLGAIAEIAWQLTGGLDDLAQKLLGSDQDSAAPPYEPYMQLERDARDETRGAANGRE